MTTRTNHWRVDIVNNPGVTDAHGQGVLGDIRDLGQTQVKSVESARVFLLDGPLSREQATRIAAELLAAGVGEQFGGGIGHAHAEHAVASGEPKPVDARRRTDDRQVVIGHRAPTPPFLDALRANRFVQEFARAAYQCIEADAIQCLVVAGEFHCAAKPITRRPRRHTDARFGQNEWPPRCALRSDIGDRIALAGLDRDTQAEIARNQGRPSAARQHHVARGNALAAGMHGAVIIEPDGLPEVDRSYVIVQSEVYLGQGGSGAADATEVDAAQVATAQPDKVVFNGIANQYDQFPFQAGVGERVRFWVLAAGPNLASSFHIVGGQFDTVYFEGGYHLRRGVDAFGQAGGGSQALGMQAAQGGFVELTFPEAGHYPVVSHIMSDAERGAHGIVEVTD